MAHDCRCYTDRGSPSLKSKFGSLLDQLGDAEEVIRAALLDIQYVLQSYLCQLHSGLLNKEGDHTRVLGINQTIICCSDLVLPFGRQLEACSLKQMSVPGDIICSFRVEYPVITRSHGRHHVHRNHQEEE